MIERLLAADAALERGELDTAERLFGQVADADPRNAIAAVGLGRVAAGRDDAEGARTWFQRALEIDPDEAAARRLLTALDRVLAAEAARPDPAPLAREAEPSRAGELEPTSAADVETTRSAEVEPTRAGDVASPATSPRRSIFGRIRAWLRLSGR